MENLPGGLAILGKWSKGRFFFFRGRALCGGFVRLKCDCKRQLRGTQV